MQRNDDVPTGSTGTRPRFHVAAIVLAAITALALPVGVWAADSFSDVPDSNVHHDAINAIADAGITGGCTATQYCPKDPVLRDQMASFLDRVAALSGQTPVVNAATAVDADRLDGRHATDLVAAGVHVTRNDADAPVVDRWFNYVNGTQPTVTGSGLYTIDFGFDATSAFVQCTVDTNFVDTRDAVCTASTPGGNTIRVRTHDVSAGSEQPAEFWVLVYGTANP